ARGNIAFQAEKSGLLGTSTKLGILTTPETRERDAVDARGAPLPPGPPGSAPQMDADAQFRRDKARRRPMDDATDYLDRHLTVLGGSDGYIEPDDMLKLGKDVAGFDKQLEQYVVTNGWFREPPATSTRRWSGRGVLFGVLGVVALIAGFNL